MESTLLAPAFLTPRRLVNAIMETALKPEVTDGAESDEDLLILRSSTLTALTSFLDEQAADLKMITSRTTQFCPPDLGDLQQDHEINKAHAETPTSKSEETQGCGTSSGVAVPIARFKRLFKENWQLSQFWYTQDTAERLAQALQGICSIKAHVAFVCCPTGYVAFKDISPPSQSSILLEYDRRFSVVAGTNFVYYNLDAPLSSPCMEALGGSQDVVVVDPPFHSEVSQKKIALTVAHILRPGGQLILLTGLTLSSLINSIYQPPLPKLRRRGFDIEHDGIGRLATPYGCWTGGGPDDQVEEEFGESMHDELC